MKRVEALESYDEELHSGGPLASNPKAQELLDGPWRLLYSDASEITNLVDLPLGFRLGAVFQPIDVQTGRVENQANVKHRFLLASAHTRVLARFGLEEDLKAKNRAGVSNTEGRRVNVQFEKVVFSLRRVLFVPFLSRLVRRVARPRGPAEKALEAMTPSRSGDGGGRGGWWWRGGGGTKGGGGKEVVVVEEAAPPPVPSIDVTRGYGVSTSTTTCASAAAGIFWVALRAGTREERLVHAQATRHAGRGRHRGPQSGRSQDLRRLQGRSPVRRGGRGDLIILRWLHLGWKKRGTPRRILP